MLPLRLVTLTGQSLISAYFVDVLLASVQIRVVARKLRVEYPGAVYHVMNRGDRREDIFRTDQDRALFVDTLAEACGKTGWQVHAFCLMPNHFHLVLETPNANLVAGMKWFLCCGTGEKVTNKYEYVVMRDPFTRRLPPQPWP